ncbi:MAG: rhodanese-like domain-containing protein [Candidatus Kapaibacterium sp.]
MKLIRDILIIILASAAIGLAYNFMSGDPLPIFAQKSDYEIPDEVIFGDAHFDNESILHKSVTYEQLVRALDYPGIILIDSRRPEQYQNGTIDEAINIFPYAPEEEYFEKLFTLDPEKTYIIFCDGGTCDLSHMVAKDMMESGFTSVFLYRGGWEEWTRNQLA